jgi:hypothetical protein
MPRKESNRSIAIEITFGASSSNGFPPIGTRYVINTSNDDHNIVAEQAGTCRIRLLTTVHGPGTDAFS